MHHAIARGVLLAGLLISSMALADTVQSPTTATPPATATQPVQGTAQTPAVAVTPAVATAPAVQTGTQAVATGTTATAAATPASDRNTLVCRRMDPPTGTRLGGRTVCATAAQWDEVTRHSEDAISGIQDRGAVAHIPGGQ